MMVESGFFKYCDCNRNKVANQKVKLIIRKPKFFPNIDIAMIFENLIKDSIRISWFPGNCSGV
jgi:hypothetical protein